MVRTFIYKTPLPYYLKYLAICENAALEGTAYTHGYLLMVENKATLSVKIGKYGIHKIYTRS